LRLLPRVAVCVLLACCAAAQPAPSTYLNRVEKALQLGAQDLRAMTPAANQVAARITTGGNLYASGHPALVSEVTGRAGGLMLLQDLGNKTPTAADAVLFFGSPEHPLLPKISELGALVVSFGLEDAQNALKIPVLGPESGISNTLGMTISAWLFTSELIAACTRLNKMPVIYETIASYDGQARTQQFKDKGIFWHDSHNVPNISPTQLGEAYIKQTVAMLKRVSATHRPSLDRAAQWAREAKLAGRQTIMLSMGHLVPAEIENSEIGAFFKPGRWNAGFKNNEPLLDPFRSGDCVVHIGYQFPPAQLLREANAARANVVYLSILADRDFPSGQRTAYIDPMWPWADACVDLPGYDIPILPASAILNATIAWELYRLASAG